MEAENEAQARVFEIARDKTVDAAQALKAKNIRRDAHPVHDGVERRVAQLLEADAAYFLAQRHEAVVVDGFAGAEAFDLGDGGLAVAAIGEGGAVGEAHVVERVHPAQVDIVGPASKLKPS